VTEESIPCGGCGAKSNSERCIGCFHDFGTPESAWVRKYYAERHAPETPPHR